ncbi:MAG: flagellar hook-associated protein FlgK, partial [Magnetospirillum sp.]|nr:flagellar hook-associated protein FlgK [Magnetospirillum sp.]
DSTGKLGNTITVAKGASLQTIADAINAQTQTNESAALNTTSWTLTSNATITVSDASGSLLSVTLTAPGPHTLQEIAGTLTQGTLTGSVVQDGTASRLRLTDSRGLPLTVSISGGGVSGSTMSLEQTLDMTQTKRIEASVVPEGSGYRLRIRQTKGSEAYASSTLDAQSKNLLSDIGLQRASTGTASNMSVRADIQAAPEKISRGSMQWNSDVGRYYLSEGDNSAALEMSRVMNAKTDINTAGSIYAGKYGFAEYAASTLSMVAQESGSSKSQMSYQTSLNASLDFQNTSFSGVNLDEEISSMMDFQQAYSASAKVISVLQDMLETLNSMIR